MSTLWVPGDPIPDFSGGANLIQRSGGIGQKPKLGDVLSGMNTALVAAAAEAGISAMQKRVRVAVAAINAGATLIAAVTGKQIRLMECIAIAIGGAVGAVTSIDVKGTLSSARILVSFLQAQLTRSTVLRSGATGATVLADGASYTANDAATAITVIKAGADITVATHIDFLLTYGLD